MSFKSQQEVELVSQLKSSNMRQYLDTYDNKLFIEYAQVFWQYFVQADISAMKLLLDLGSGKKSRAAKRLLNSSIADIVPGIPTSIPLELHYPEEALFYYPLFYAIIKQFRMAIQLFIDYGANVNKQVQGITPLLLACKLNASRLIVQDLLNAGCNINDGTGDTACYPLDKALSQNNDDLACLLIERGAKLKTATRTWSAIHTAAVSSCNRSLLMILKRRVDVNETMNLIITMKDKKYCLKVTPLESVMQIKWPALLDNFKAYSKIYSSNETEKMFISDFKRFLGTIKLLLSKGGDANVRTIFSSGCPLIYHPLCFTKRYSLIEYICNYNPVHYLSFDYIIETIVVELIKHGANVNPKNYYGRTPLHLALRADNLCLAMSLLNSGANVNSTDCKGFTPLHYTALYVKERQIHGSLAKRMDDYCHVIQMFLKKGVLLHKGRKGRLSIFNEFLHVARNKDILKLLLAHDLRNKVGPNLADKQADIDWDMCTDFSEMLLLHLARQEPALNGPTLRAMNKQQRIFYVKCLDEIRRMKTDIFYKNISVYNLCENNVEVAIPAKDKNFIKAFEMHCCSIKYPLFADILAASVKEANKHIEAVPAALLLNNKKNFLIKCDE